MRCPMCGRNAPPRPENPYGPFCSRRCRMADLSKWISGDYAIPGEPVNDEALEARPRPADGREPEQ